jgi:hypothetical protein
MKSYFKKYSIIWSKSLILIFSIYIQNATSFGPDKKSSDIPKANNQKISGHIFSVLIISLFWQQHPSFSTPYSTFFCICTMHAQGRNMSAMPNLHLNGGGGVFKVALGMAATLRTPHLEVGLETVHKTGKQGMF